MQWLQPTLGSASKRTPSLLDQTSAISRYHDSTTRLFLFDWDGTLTPIVRNPTAAVPTPAVLDILRGLSTHPRDEVWIISGRDPDFLAQCFDDTPLLALSAEHGAFVRRRGHGDWEDTARYADETWQDDVMIIMQKFTNETPGSAIERKNTSITWHYRNAEPEVGQVKSNECRCRLEEMLGMSYANIEVTSGKMCLEVRPRGINKGTIVHQILSEYASEHGSRGHPQFVFCAGDDSTDEGCQSAAMPESCAADIDVRYVPSDP